MRLLEFVFKAYAPVAVISQPIGNSDYAYTFAQSANTIDLEKLLRILSKREMGWNLSDGILFSPRPSTVNLNNLVCAISTARIPDRTA